MLSWGSRAVCRWRVEQGSRWLLCVCVCVCTAYAHVCICIHCTYVESSKKDTSVLFSNSLIYVPETGSVAIPNPQAPSNPPIWTLHSVGITNTHMAFHTGARNMNLGPRACTAGTHTHWALLLPFDAYTPFSCLPVYTYTSPFFSAYHNAIWWQFLLLRYNWG